jgi:hypothetical protein
MEYIGKDDSNIRIGAILGLGIAYAGSQKEEVQIITVLLSQHIGYIFLIYIVLQISA